MKYILHDTSASDDEKLSELIIEYGYEGSGLFWAILEKIGKQEKPIKTSVLKAQLKVGKKLEKVWSFLEEIGLISSSNGETFNKQLLNYSETYKIKKEKNAKRISDWRNNQPDAENVTRSENVRNAPKVNRSKVNRLLEPKGSPDLQSGTPNLKVYKLIELKDKRTVFEFIKNNKPTFIEPYADLWNLFATERGKPIVKILNNTRRKKFSVRIRDPEFKFSEILSKAGKSDFLMQHAFFGFDWIIENETNYAKVLEGSYGNDKKELINNHEDEAERKRLEEKTRRLEQ